MSKTNQNTFERAQSALRFMANAQGVSAPQCSTEQEALALLSDASAVVAQVKAGRDRLYLAAVLAIAATRNEAAGDSHLKEIEEAAPMEAASDTARRQARHVVRLCLRASAARFKPRNTADFAATFGEAMDFARKVNIAAIQKADKAKRDAAKEEKEGEEAVTGNAVERKKTEAVADLLTQAFATLAARAANGEPEARAALALHMDMVATLAKSQAQAARVTKAPRQEQLAA